MTQRKAEETVCPRFAAALIVNQGTFYNVSNAASRDEDEIMEAAKCLGEKCQTFSPGDRKCGLRRR